jgi:hypothetical protein
MTRKSTRLTGEITRITETTKTVEITTSSTRIRRRRGLFVALMMQRSDVRSIAKLFWITRRYHHQQHRWLRTPDGVNIVGAIPPTTISRWRRST